MTYHSECDSNCVQLAVILKCHILERVDPDGLDSTDSNLAPMLDRDKLCGQNPHLIGLGFGNRVIVLCPMTHSLYVEVGSQHGRYIKNSSASTPCSLALEPRLASHRCCSM
jgi:hypothetical protein